MPAILFAYSGRKPVIYSHHHRGSIAYVEIKGRDYILHERCVGFICNAGARLIGVTKLAKLIAAEITNGDGDEGCEWRPVPAGEYVWCVVQAKKFSDYECLVLVDDYGWPILTGKTRYEFLPPEEDIPQRPTALDGAYNYGPSTHKKTG